MVYFLHIVYQNDDSKLHFIIRWCWILTGQRLWSSGPA